MSTPQAQELLVPVLPAGQRRVLVVLVLLWVVGTLAFWRWALRVHDVGL